MDGTGFEYSFVMKLQWSLRVAVVTFLFSCLGSAISPDRRAHAQLGVSFGGRATAVHVSVPTSGTNVVVADTGGLPASGGGVGAAMLAANIPGELTAGLLTLAATAPHAATVGLDRARSDASVGKINLTISGNGISADFLMARSEAGCLTGPALAGGSQLANLGINGHIIAVTGAPNQRVALPNGDAILNEQLASVASSAGGLVVNALHVTTRDVLTGKPVADVVLASADAQVQCQARSAWNLFGPLRPAAALAATAEPAFASGGGWITGNFGGHATLGFIGGAQPDGMLMGHLVFDDPNVVRVVSTAITSFTPGCTSTIEGEGQSEGGPGHFVVTVQDNGEPGNRDTFTIEFDSYSNNNPLLGGGNIQADGSVVGGKVLAHGRTCP
jgi:hypothetical protein